jgi:hypothetical protein
MTAGAKTLTVDIFPQAAAGGAALATATVTFNVVP